MSNAVAMETMLELWDELRARPGPFRFRLAGSSMWPFAPSGSLLAVTPSLAPELAPGDLVTFRAGRRIVTHRVVAIDADGSVLAWGDASLRADAPVAPADVLGRTAVIERGPVWIGPRTPWLVVRRAVASAVRRAHARKKARIEAAT